MPTSTMAARLRAMMSGMRNDPPISTSSPRDTMASRPAANSESTIMTAAALLLTARAASAPVSAQTSCSQCAWRLPRSMASTSYSSVE